jgi:biopolymer transport protein ExbD
MEINRRIKSKKLNTRVDLTAMVSVSFLLIIFFMLVGELSKPKIMALSLPEDYTCGGYNGCGDENRVLTVLLGNNDKIVTYSGILEVPLDPPKNVKYGSEGIRKELLRKNKAVLEYSANKGRLGRGITVIIKPSKKSNFRNLVDILDEMKIADIGHYTIVNDFTPEEAKLLAVK